MSDFTADPFQGRPWMYSMPKGNQLKNEWLVTWKNVLLEIAEIQNIQLINKLDLRNKSPLNRLDQESYEELINPRSLLLGKWKPQNLLEEHQRLGRQFV